MICEIARFSVMAILNGTKTAPAGRSLKITLIEEAQTEALANDNMGEKRLSDSSMKRILKEYPEVRTRLLKFVAE